MNTATPAIDYIYGLSPSKMLWIYKQILLPRITYGAHVCGHYLTLEQQHIIKTLESLTFMYFAQIWRTTPTASLEVILNKKPAHLEVLSTAIKTFMRIKDQFQINFWDDIPLDNRGCSHLKKLKQITSQLYLEGQSLDSFTSDYLTQNDHTHNNTDHVLPTVDVTIQRPDYVIPVEW